MARVKCDYCGNYIDDTLLSCPNCGAPNSKLTRTTETTPKTIEQLQDWYKTMNLPPENVTRFFIDKDIKEPKAFGIYKEGTNFIVYKNKADGSRAVRYKGSDEAYAVNELYLKLKEEILFQKNKNVKQRQYEKATYGSKKPAIRTHSFEKRSFSFDFLFENIINWLCIISAVGFIFVTIGGIVGSLIFQCIELYGYPQSNTYYYQEADDDLYFYDGTSGDIYEWWKFDTIKGKWNYTEAYSRDFIGGLTSEDEISQDDVLEKFSNRNIYKSKEYIDSGHHYKPSLGYYSYNDQIWYYLDDSNHWYGNNNDNSGWYTYDENTHDWTYYSDYDDKQSVPPELYYNPDEFYSFSNNPSSDWYVKDFENTEWYREYQDHEQSYESYWDSYQNSQSSSNDWGWDWSSDSSWSWDSGSSWDSGWSSSGWDSDW